MSRVARLVLAALLLLPAVPTAAAVEKLSEARGASTQEHAPPSRRLLVMLRLPPEHYRPNFDYGGAGGYGDQAAAQARRRLAARLARDEGLTLEESWAMPLLGVDCVVMTVPGTEPLEAVAARLSHRPGVAWSQPLNEFTAQGEPAGPTRRSGADPRPNDRLFLAQPAARAWQLADLHRIATGEGVRVAIIDSQVDARHPDLMGRVTTQRDFVGTPAPAPERHGTGVAGIIAAQANNGMGIVGVAPGARLMALRACWQRSAAATICDSLSLARALTYAIENGAQVVNMSLSGPDDLLLTRLIQAGLRRGMAVVAAVDPQSGTGFPASVHGVIGVADDGLASVRAGVYNAPGRDVPTTEPGGRWYLVSGNSYAAAHVSGLLALTRQLNGRRDDRPLVAVRADGGAIDACGTVLRAARRNGRRCGG